jgi:ATP sulfurylase
MIINENFKFSGFNFPEWMIFQEIYKVLNRSKILSQLENKVKIQDYKRKKHEIWK